MVVPMQSLHDKIGYIPPWKIQPVCFPILWRLSLQSSALLVLLLTFSAVDQPDTCSAVDEVHLYPAAVI